MKQITKITIIIVLSCLINNITFAQWGFIGVAGRTTAGVPKIGIGFMPAIGNINAKLHVNSFLLAADAGTDGLLFRTDGINSVENNWRLFTGATNGTQVERFRLLLPAGSDNPTLRAAVSGANMQFQTTTIVPFTRMIITSNVDGFIGMGNSFLNPQSQLHINNGLATYLHITNIATNVNQFLPAASDGFRIGIAANGTAELRQQENQDMLFFTSASASERMRIVGTTTLGTRQGYVGIGNNNPEYHVDIQTPALFSEGEQMLRCRSAEDLASSIGFINSAAQASLVVNPTLFGLQGPNQTGSALWYIGNIDPTQDVAGLLPVHLSIASQGWVPNTNAVARTNAIQNRPIYGWRNGPDQLMTMDARGFVGLGLLPNNTLPNNRLEINSDFYDMTQNPPVPGATQTAATPNPGQQAQGYGVPTGFSGLRFTDLLSTSVPQLNPSTGVLSVDANGDVILVPGTGIGTCALPTTLAAGVNGAINLNNNNNFYFIGNGAGNTVNNVAIGKNCTSPIAKLDVLQGSTTAASLGIYVRSTDVTGSIGLKSSITYSSGTTNIAGWFECDPGAVVQRAIIVPNGGGYVGIGTTAPGYLLEVNGNAAKPGGGTWTSTSDSRLKSDIVPFNDGLEVLRNINPVNYHFNDESGFDVQKEHVGVIAQEIMQYAPYTVGTYIKTNNEGVENEYYNFDASALTYILINSVKEQQIQLDVKELRISRLENELLTMSTTLASCCSLGESFKTEEEPSTINIHQLNSTAKDLPVLSQNRPNPFNEKSIIRFYLPKGTKNGSIKVFDTNGAIYRLFALTGEGPGTIAIEANTLEGGTYYYSLLVENNVIDTKTMVITQ